VKRRNRQQGHAGGRLIAAADARRCPFFTPELFYPLFDNWTNTGSDQNRAGISLSSFCLIFSIKNARHDWIMVFISPANTYE
jgi:hypothetical protein